jgi:replicative DNA helicase
MAVVDDLPHPGMDASPPSEDYGRQPPQDLAAEQSVLGGMLLSKDAIADVLERLRPGDFYRPAHQNVYDAILDLYGRGEPADAVTVAAELDRRGLLRRIGGADPTLVWHKLSVPWSTCLSSKSNTRSAGRRRWGSLYGGR